MFETLYALPVATRIKTQYQNGQVFIQWTEQTENEFNLRVYVSEKPIRRESFDKARLLTDKLQPHSANDWYEDPNLCPKTSGPARGWRIEEHQTPLNRAGGLFVHTVTSKTPQGLYFAVLAQNETPEDLVAGQNSLQNPVKAHSAPIRPIWQLESPEPHQEGKGKALALYLGSHTSRPAGILTHLLFGTPQMGWREGLAFKFKVSILKDVVLVEPYDRVWINRHLNLDETYEKYNTLYKHIETFWYGTNDKIYDSELRKTGTPVNYTERILLYLLEWVQTHYQTDPNKVYAYGASMGTGVLRLATQNPDRFASVDLLVPFFDFGYERGNESNAKRFQSCCGPMDLICSDGMPLGQRLDLVQFMENCEQDLPFIVARVGRNDQSVYWRRKPAFIEATQQNKQGLLLGWDDGTHATAMRYKIASFPGFREYDWFIRRFTLNQSYPVFTNFQLDQNPGSGDKKDGDTEGFINYGLNWKQIEDRKDSYRVTILLKRPDARFPVTVDVTPRNLQNFTPKPKETLTIKNLDTSGALVSQTEVKVDKNGLFTCKNFMITSPKGNQMIISKK